MRRPRTKEEIDRLFLLFGVNIVARLSVCRSFEEVTSTFDQAKADAKAGHRRLALKHHPDRGGDEEKIKQLNAAWAIIRDLKVTPKPKPRPQVVCRGPTVVSVFINVSLSTNTSTTSGATTATGAPGTTGGW